TRNTSAMVYSYLLNLSKKKVHWKLTASNSGISSSICMTKMTWSGQKKLHGILTIIYGISHSKESRSSFSGIPRLTNSEKHATWEMPWYLGSSHAASLKG